MRVAAAVLALTAPQAALLATAQAKCNPNRPKVIGNWQDGWNRQDAGNTIGGTYSQVLNYSPWVASSPGFTDDVSAWVMLDDASDQDPDCSYGQIGWLEQPENARKGFVEWTRPSGDGCVDGKPNDEYFAAPALNTYTYYQVLFGYTGPGELSFCYGQGSASHLEYTATPGFKPNQVIMDGEIHTLASQMPGGERAGRPRGGVYRQPLVHTV